MTGLDPFTMIYNAHWSLLEASADFVAAIPDGNRIKFSGALGQKTKDTVSDADLPEVQISPDSITPRIEIASNTCLGEMVNAIQICTKDQRTTIELFPLVWIIFRAMANVREYLVHTVTWNDKPLILDVEPTEVALGQSDPEKNRGIKGWSSVWKSTTTFHVHTSDLLTT